VYRPYLVRVLVTNHHFLCLYQIQFLYNILVFYLLIFVKVALLDLLNKLLFAICIHFQNHKMLKRILNHEEFVGHPLRKDYEITKGQYCTVSQDMMDEMQPLLDARNLNIDKDELMIVNLGPSHPASHGTIRTLVALDGETIAAAAS